MLEMMCFVVVYHNNHLIMQGMKNDDGESTYQYAKEMEMAFRIFVNGKCIKSGWYK